MPRSPFDPCIPTKAAKVPARPEWLHEIKHDGYRLIVQRDGKSVRLWTKGGHDWSHRFPLITEAALRNRNSSFVLDGEAVLLGVDGRSTLTACIHAGTTMSDFEQGEIGPTCSGMPAFWGWRAWCRSTARAAIAAADSGTGSRSRTGSIRRLAACGINLVEFDQPRNSQVVASTNKFLAESNKSRLSIFDTAKADFIGNDVSSAD